MSNELINSLIEEIKVFIDNELSKYNYSSDIKHLLYLVIPAFIIKYDLKNKNKILTTFKEVPLIETSEDDKTHQAFYTSIPKRIDNKIITKKYIVLKHYQNKELIELIDNIIHEYNHAINSYENEIKISNNYIYLRTGLSYARYDKTTLKYIGLDDREILEEILNTKQTEEVMDILKEMSNYEIEDYSSKTTLYSINNIIDSKYSSKAYSLQTTFLKNLSNNKTFINTLSNLRFTGNIEEISYIFDNSVGKEGSYNKLITILNEVTKLEKEYSKTIFKKIKLNKIKSLYNEINRLIDTFNNNYHYK
ncbi:MAG: hypothetical protein IJL76_00835 [Bacilli bacterium]|nr:hypothetical protein [Bacilli bacterium]